MDSTTRRRAGAAPAALKFTAGDAERFLDAMAREVRALYAQHRRYAAMRAGKEPTWGFKAIARWDGGEDANGKTYVPIWPKIAGICALHQIDVRLFIEAQFADYAGGDPPRPDLLLRASALQKYHDHVRGSEHDLRMDWDNEFRHFRTKSATRERTLGESPGQAAFYILADPGNDLSALFRFCLATLGESRRTRSRETSISQEMGEILIRR